MSHQVLVPEKDRILLRFLRWEDHNINNSIADFQMGEHVFGGTSYLSCCSYTLKRTPPDNDEEKYQKDATDTFIKKKLLRRRLAKVCERCQHCYLFATRSH